MIGQWEYKFHPTRDAGARYFTLYVPGRRVHLLEFQSTRNTLRFGWQSAS